MTDSILIVGAGEAGIAAASALREHGFAGRVRVAGEGSVAHYDRLLLATGARYGDDR